MKRVIKIEDLVVEAKRGNKEAYSKLIESVEKDLYKVARARLNNEEDCKDVIQDTIITAYLNIGKLKNNSKFKPWIIKILINKCNSFYGKNKKREEIAEKCKTDYEVTEDFDSKINFEDIIKSLNEKERKIFELYYDDGLTIKQISRMLNINENTVKTNLSRGKIKIKKTYRPATIFMFILCLLVATSVIAVSIISYIKSLFELNSVGVDNDGVLMAIENMHWFQEVEMEYIDLGDGYKIKLEYLLMDEMNLYMVVNFESEKDISKYTDLMFPDLKVTNENNEVICDKSNIMVEQYSNITSTKTIENNNNSIRTLIYMHTDNFPISSRLDISFSRIMLSKKSIISKNEYSDINLSANFKVDLDKKFIDRKTTTYLSKEKDVEKAIITETGFHAIIISEDINTIEAVLIDENGNSYMCYSAFISGSNLKNIILANYNNMEAKELKLLVNDKEYILYKEE